jgi:hypothetical protein
MLHIRKRNAQAVILRPSVGARAKARVTVGVVARSNGGSQKACFKADQKAAFPLVSSGPIQLELAAVETSERTYRATRLQQTRLGACTVFPIHMLIDALL